MNKFISLLILTIFAWGTIGFGLAMITATYAHFQGQIQSAIFHTETTVPAVLALAFMTALCTLAFVLTMVMMYIAATPEDRTQFKKRARLTLGTLLMIAALITALTIDMQTSAVADAITGIASMTMLYFSYLFFTTKEQRIYHTWGNIDDYQN
jgi:hypothetical protein